MVNRVPLVSDSCLDWKECYFDYGGDMTAGWFWRTWDGRHLLRGYINKVRTGELTRAGFPKRNLWVDKLHRTVGARGKWNGYTRERIPRNYQPTEYPHRIGFKDFQISESWETRSCWS